MNSFFWLWIRAKRVADVYLPLQIILIAIAVTHSVSTHSDLALVTVAIIAHPALAAIEREVTFRP